MFPWSPEPISTALGRRNYIRFNISHFTWEQFSANSILDSLKEIGIGIRRTDFLAIRRDIKDMIERGDMFADVPNESLLPIARFIQNHKATLTQTLQYRYRFDATDMDTGEQVELNRALSSNWWRTKQEALDHAADYFTNLLERYNLRIDEITLREVWKDPNRSPIR